MSSVCVRVVTFWNGAIIWPDRPDWQQQQPLLSKQRKQRTRSLWPPSLSIPRLTQSKQINLPTLESDLWKWQVKTYHATDARIINGNLYVFRCSCMVCLIGLLTRPPTRPLQTNECKWITISRQATLDLCPNAHCVTFVSNNYNQLYLLYRYIYIPYILFILAIYIDHIERESAYLQNNLHRT